MPLLDHFRLPLSQRRPSESFHATWASALADVLNRELPEGYIALEQIHSGAPVEIDVATFEEHGGKNGAPVGTVTKAVWLPATAPIILPMVFPESCTVEIVSSEGGRTLVAAIELVSPGNKDRADKRRQFVAKCMAYLSRGIGLIIVDVVTTRSANLHNELMELLGQDGAKLPADAAIYCAAYRPLQEADGGRIDAWPTPLTLGEPLPQMPLSLGAELCIAADLEAGYREACERRKVM